MNKKNFSLNNGNQIPSIGFGTWRIPDGITATNSVKAAIEFGYRHIDCAAAYSNEKSVGTALKESGIKRNELFITSKLKPTEHAYDKAKQGLSKTLEDLRLDYLDLYLVHWPNPISVRSHWQDALIEVWNAFEESYHQGLVKSIGVCNCHPHHLDVILKNAKVVPSVNQIRLCPGDVKEEVINWSRKNNILVEAYSPLGGDQKNLLKDGMIIELGEKYNKSPSQLCLCWAMQQEYLPLPRSVTRDHIKANYDIYDFVLEKEDIEKLNKLSGYPDPFPHPDNITW